MFKKFFIAAMFSVVVIQLSVCGANMPRNEMYLGGLTVGSTLDEMTGIYGNYDSYNPGVEGLALYEYGDSVAIGYNSFSKKIISILVNANNGWTTPAGLAVGMNISDSVDLYGAPDYSETGDYKAAHCYFFYDDSGNVRKLAFIILFDKNSGEILEMRCFGNNPMQSVDEYFFGETPLNYLLSD